MTTVTDPIATPTPAPVPAQTGETTGSSGDLNSDFDTFLTLLTTQIKNQDPLEPIDNTEFVAQLATFSNVEQGVRTNELLEDMISRLGGQDVASAATWIGMEVQHSGPIAGDAPARTLHADIPAAADAADLVVTDSFDREVRRQAVDPNSDTIAWPGASGPLPPGQYNLRVEPRVGDQPMASIPVSHYDTVREVAPTGAGPELLLADGTRLPASELQTVRAPAPD